MDHRIEANRKNWNERTPVHAVSEFYDVAGFRNGRITLNDIERTRSGFCRRQVAAAPSVSLWYGYDVVGSFGGTMRQGLTSQMPQLISQGH